jgi:hypothetical protein
LTITFRVARVLDIRGTTGPITARRLGIYSLSFAPKVPLRSRQSARPPWMRSCVDTMITWTTCAG